MAVAVSMAVAVVALGSLFPVASSVTVAAEAMKYQRRGCLARVQRLHPQKNEQTSRRLRICWVRNVFWLGKEASPNHKKTPTTNNAWIRQVAENVLIPGFGEPVAIAPVPNGRTGLSAGSTTCFDAS